MLCDEIIVLLEKLIKTVMDQKMVKSIWFTEKIH